MAKNTFFLRTNLTSSGTSYVSDNIDISAYTDPSRGKVLVVDRGFITFSTDGQGPVKPTDVVSSGTGSRAINAQVLTESQTTLAQADDNALFMLTNFYAAVGTAGVLTMVNEQNAMNPAEYENGFIVPTDKIHCGIQTGTAWTAELDVGFVFEVHTEKISLSRMQELLVSLTA
tara:strand:+ start:1538 stop:2056 length:519 start_codon:yes stop_codon:yes gene_type:complete